MDWSFYLLAFFLALALTGSAVWALRWAVKAGQFHDLEKGATVIFDDDEPVGRITDRFPGASRSAVPPPAVGSELPKLPR
jgi:cbb3-type cytochrome oxidase maturation protein